MSHHHDHGHPTVSAKPMSRRSLLKALAASSVAIGAGAALTAPVAASAAGTAQAALPTVSSGRRLVPINRIGIQLYTIRDKVSSLGFRAVFEELASIGYSEIEFAGYTQNQVGPITPAEIRQLLDDNGLRAVGAHNNLNPNNIDAQIETANILGMPHLGQGGPLAGGYGGPIPRSQWMTAIETWNQMGEKTKAAGLKLYTHTHSQEWGFTTDTNERVYDLYLENLDADKVFFEMDVYWAFVGQYRFPGFEPVDYVKRYPRRFPLLHLKDGKLNPANSNGYDIIEFGAGDINYTEFLSQLGDRGQRFGMYEQDNAATAAVPPNPLNSLGNADRSYQKIAALRG
ncbi:sugar phosphate isomerase/epimerase [Microbacterium sp. SLBN-146]|uniref:sugar phosphate isomerase/epimerase family protein n=1 Tax=Microbacterium sp. SLBN-146 TaxID=2768457 RepID=UPI00116B9923|nr:TIM barrel protein [Microbacterium sp. SLBN-146]TQJ31162.1 sugar phosphate isomerase/epimerase [Microbacterium sp. SLBN-146]